MTTFYERVKLVTLWDMLKFKADQFVKAMAELARLEQLIELAEKKFGENYALIATTPAVGMDKILGSHPIELEKQLTELGLRVSAKGVSDLQNAAINGKPIPEFRLLLAHIRMSIQAELQGTCLLHVAFNRCEYYEAKELFGSEVATSFPSSIVNIEEAGKCFALERYTACVFHLMTVVEVGLRVLGASLHDATLDPKTNPNWQKILERCDKELAKSPKDRSPEWLANGQFYADATANLRAVKDAWRNPTLHIGIPYDEEKALDVFNSVKAFMRSLATKLHE